MQSTKQQNRDNFRHSPLLCSYNCETISVYSLWLNRADMPGKWICSQLMVLDAFLRHRHKSELKCTLRTALMPPRRAVMMMMMMMTTLLGVTGIVFLFNSNLCLWVREFDRRPIGQDQGQMCTSQLKAGTSQSQPCLCPRKKSLHYEVACQVQAMPRPPYH